MKKLKKSVGTAVLAAALAALLTVPAFAASTAGANRVSKLQQEQQAIEQRISANSAKAAADAANAQKRTGIRQQLLEDRATVLGNRDKNLAILDQNKTLRIGIAQAIQSLKANGGSVPEQTLGTLKADNQQISSIWAAMKATKGQIKTIEEQNKTAVKNNDLAALDSNFQQIYGIQNTRNTQLAQINSILQQMETLLQSAVSAGSSSSSSSSSATAAV